MHVDIVSLLVCKSCMAPTFFFELNKEVLHLMLASIHHWLIKHIACPLTSWMSGWFLGLCDSHLLPSRRPLRWSSARSMTSRSTCGVWAPSYSSVWPARCRLSKKYETSGPSTRKMLITSQSESVPHLSLPPPHPPHVNTCPFHIFALCARNCLVRYLSLMLHHLPRKVDHHTHLWSHL